MCTVDYCSYMEYSIDLPNTKHNRYTYVYSIYIECIVGDRLGESNNSLNDINDTAK